MPKKLDSFLNLSEQTKISRQSTFAVSFNINFKRYAKENFIAWTYRNVGNNLIVNAKYANQDSSFRRWFVGNTLFLLGNLAPTNPPGFVQLNFGDPLTGKDVITLEPETWKYA